MLRVLHVTNAFPYEEVPEYGIFVKEQIDSLSSINSGIQSDTLFINGRKFGRKAYISGVWELRQRARQYDLIHCHHLYSSFVTALALTGKPTVVSFLNDWLHEMDGVRSTFVRKLGCNFGAQWANRIILKSRIPAQFRNDKRFILLPNGVNSTQFKIEPKDDARKILGLRPDAIYVLFVSSKNRDRPQKRYDRFTEVLAEVKKNNPGRDIEELVLVNQDRDKVSSFFNAADLHLMTSDFEGSPNSVKEALCCGISVVSTDVGNVRDMLSGLPNCYVSSTFEAPELAALVQKSIEASVSRENVRDAFLEKDLSQKSVAEKLIRIYTELADKSS